MISWHMWNFLKEKYTLNHLTVEMKDLRMKKEFQIKVVTLQCSEFLQITCFQLNKLFSLTHSVLTLILWRSLYPCADLTYKALIVAENNVPCSEIMETSQT